MSKPPDKTIFDDAITDQLQETTRSWVERPILVLVDGTDMNRRYQLSKPVMIIGRDLRADVTVMDSRCSRQHAKLIYQNFNQTDQPPQVLLVDLDSTNGIFVNGVRVKEHLLCDRDKILVGSAQFGFFLRDETELESDQKLYLLALYDALTGLHNRGHFNTEIHHEFDRARRYGRAMSLVMLDIDHFKDFNDNYGHQTGDYVLQEIGRIIRANIRGQDKAARYGGEEFAIILPETALDGAYIQAERIRASVADQDFRFGGESLKITVSLGVSTIDPQLKSSDDMVRVTDRALYQAKADGRDRVCAWRNGRVQSDCATA